MKVLEIDRKFRSDLKIAVSYLKSIGCSEIYIFGSLESGNTHQASDIDLAVRGIQPEDFFFVYGELMTRLQHSVDLIDLDLQKEFGQSLIEEGQLKRVA